MTKKEKTIEACKQLAKKYRNPEGYQFFTPESCELCKLTTTTGNCIGCPMSTRQGRYGCIEFESFNDADVSSYERMGLGNVYEEEEPTPEFIARAEFFDKIIPILEKIPARRFTPSGFTYFKELDRNW